jgi:hypothetical protein
MIPPTVKEQFYCQCKQMLIALLVLAMLMTVCVWYQAFRGSPSIEEGFCQGSSINGRPLFEWKPLFAKSEDRKGCFYELLPGEDQCQSYNNFSPKPTTQQDITQHLGMPLQNCVYTNMPSSSSDGNAASSSSAGGTDSPSNPRSQTGGGGGGGSGSGSINQMSLQDVSLALPKAVVQQCDVDACNSRMKSWIVDRFWAFNDSSNYFTECKACPSRSFAGPMNVMIDGQWKLYGNSDKAYAAAMLRADGTWPSPQPAVSPGPTPGPTPGPALSS